MAIPSTFGSRSYYDPQRKRMLGSIFGSEEDADREAYVTDRLRAQNDAESLTTKINRIGSSFAPLFDDINRTKFGAEFEGKKFGGVDFGRGGVTTNRTALTGGAMPTAARRTPAPADYLVGGRGTFDVTSDPRVQQALVTQALTALEPDEFAFDAGWGPAMGSKREAAETRAFGQQQDFDRRTARFEDDLAETYEPRQMGRKLNLARTFGPDMARVQAEIGDIGSEAEARREWLPYRAGLRQQEFDQKYRMATDPARLAAESRTNVAGITGQSRVDAARARQPDQIELLISALEAARSGGWGVDPDGRPLGPPEELKQRLRDFFMQGGPAPGGPTSGGAAGAPTSGGQQFGPDIEQLIQDGISRGLARDRNEAIAALRQRGLIR